MKKNVFRVVLNLIMFFLFLLMFNAKVINESFHEIGGLVVFVLFLIHIALSWKWIVKVTQNLFNRQITWRTRLLYILHAMFLVSVITLIVTGILISESIIRNVSVQERIWKSLHPFAAALSLILAGAHIGLHWFFFRRMFTNIIQLPKALEKVFSIVLLVTVLAFGGYHLIMSDFTTWLVEPFRASSSPSDGHAVAEAGQGHQNTSNEIFFSDDFSSESSDNDNSLIQPLDEGTGETQPDISYDGQPEKTHWEAETAYPDNQMSSKSTQKVITTYGSITLGIAGFVRLLDLLFNKKKTTPSSSEKINTGRISPLDRTKLLT